MKKRIIVSVFILLSIIFIMLLILFFVKLYKVNKIINLMKINVDKNNYSYSIKDIVESVKNRIKRNKNVILGSMSLKQNVFDYYDFNSKFVYNFDNKNNSYTKRDLQEYDNEFFEFPLYKFLTSDYSFKNKLKLVFEWKIKDYDENCYEITTKNNYKIIFDKTTGVALRAMNYDLEEKFDIIIEDFKENSVTDEETKLPDLNEYSLWEGN